MNVELAFLFGGQQETQAFGQWLTDYAHNTLGVQLGPQWLTWLGLLGTQLMHINGLHLLLNVAGLLVVFWGFMPIIRMRNLLFFLFFSWVGVAAYLTLIEPLQWYVGLSGAIHGVFVAGLVLLWHCLVVAKQMRSKVMVAVAWLLTFGLLAKLGLEWHSSSLSHSQLMGSHHLGPVAVAGHRGGALVGLGLGLLCSLGLCLKWLRPHAIFSQPHS